MLKVRWEEKINEKLDEEINLVQHQIKSVHSQRKFRLKKLVKVLREFGYYHILPNVSSLFSSGWRRLYVDQKMNEESPILRGILRDNATYRKLRSSLLSDLNRHSNASYKAATLTSSTHIFVRQPETTVSGDGAVPSCWCAFTCVCVCLSHDPI